MNDEFGSLLEVERQNYLGIYLSKDKATVVCLGPGGQNRNLRGCFTVSIEDQEQKNPHTLASLITQGCAERELEFSEAALALDCALFMQHHVHSELSDPKQVAATVRFDTEEALATDIADLAIAFQVISNDQKGSKLTVFTAERKILTDVVMALQSHNLDPVTMEPDINCLSRFIRRNTPSPESQEGGTLFGILSRRRGYFITVSKSQETVAMRTFLVGSSQDREALLARETLTTTTLTHNGEPIDYLTVLDSTGAANYEQIGKKLGIKTDTLDLVGSVEIEPEALAECADPVDFAIAYGAALAHLEKAETIDFRNDFMPYQGKKLRLQNTLKFLSISVTVLLLAVGLYGQAEIFKQNKYRSELAKKLELEYVAVMPSKKLEAGINPAKKLAGELRHIRAVKSGQLSITGEESVSSKLTLLLEAFNKCAAETNLNLDTINITARSAVVSGDTSSRANTLKFFEAIRKTGLLILRHSYELKGGRDTFSVTIEPQE